MGALGKEMKLYAMPKAPLLAGAVSVGDWGVKKQPVPLDKLLKIDYTTNRRGAGLKRLAPYPVDQEK